MKFEAWGMIELDERIQCRLDFYFCNPAHGDMHVYGNQTVAKQVLQLVTWLLRSTNSRSYPHLLYMISLSIYVSS